MKQVIDIDEKKSSALVNLIKHIEDIKKNDNINKSLLNEINHDNKIILRELNKISKIIK